MSLRRRQQAENCTNSSQQKRTHFSSTHSRSTPSSLQIQRSPGYFNMYPQRCQLPIFSQRQQILTLLSQHQVIVLSGQTGCGKSTQVPQFVLEEMEERAEQVELNDIDNESFVNASII